MRTVGLRIPAGVCYLVVGLVLMLLVCHLGACGEVKTGKSNSRSGREASTSHQVQETHLQNPLQVTRSGINRQAHFQADDQQIVWLGAEDDLRRFRLFTVPLGDQSVQPLATERITCQDFDTFPHSRDIVYSALADAEPRTGEPAEPEISVAPVMNWLFDPALDLFLLSEAEPAATSGARDQATAAPTRWTHHAEYAGEPAVSWDGNLILYVTYSAEGGALHLLDRQGQSRGRLLQWPGYLGGARFSPDGQTIVFHATPRDGQPGLALYLCNHDGSNVRILTATGVHNFSPAWHPNQEFIIFSSDREEQDFELYSIRPDGSRCQRVTFSPGLDAFPDFSRSGQQLLWSSQRLVREPWQSNIWHAIWIP